VVLVLKAAQNFFENFKIKDSTYTGTIYNVLEQKNLTVAGVPVGIEQGYPKLYHPCSTNLKKTRRRWLYYNNAATDITSFTTN
jgi:hypothetical protein